MTDALILGGGYALVLLALSAFDYLSGESDSYQESVVGALWASMFVVTLLGAGRALLSFLP